MTAIKKLFLVDDDKVFTFLTTRIIAKNNLVEQVKVFGNGLDILNFIAENIHDVASLPEIILLDLNMPIMDGWQFLERYIDLLPKIDKEIKIYVLSSSIFPEDIDKAKTIQAVSDYIIKPLTGDKLINILRKNS
ncbi:MAG: response regulator [Saprospiraceae bacterium]|nr:response regulator [Saprospiraceae bacterium]